MTDDFYFIPNNEIKARSDYPSDNRTAELLYWESVKDSKEIMLYQSYIDKYPNGIFKDLAVIHIRKLGNSKPKNKEQKRPGKESITRNTTDIGEKIEEKKNNIFYEKRTGLE